MPEDNRRQYFNSLTFEETIADLCVRFIVNLPKEELESIARICFQIEQAHWFYADFCCPAVKTLPRLGFKAFSQCMFEQCYALRQWSNQHDIALEQFYSYKTKIPVRGAILLTPDLKYVLLVQGFHGKAWGYPKGKVDRDETDEECAAREVMEEVGCDIKELIDPHQFIEKMIGEKHLKLYIVTDVPKDFKFKTRTRGEIKSIAWHRIDEISKTNQDDKYSFATLLFPQLKAFIENELQRRNAHLKSLLGVNTPTPTSKSQRHKHKSTNSLFLGGKAAGSAAAASSLSLESAEAGQHLMQAPAVPSTESLPHVNSEQVASNEHDDLIWEILLKNTR